MTSATGLSSGYWIVVEREREREDSGVATGVHYGVASSLSWSMSKCNHELAFRKLHGFLRLGPQVFKDEHLSERGQASLRLSPRRPIPRFTIP